MHRCPRCNQRDDADDYIDGLNEDGEKMAEMYERATQRADRLADIVAAVGEIINDAHVIYCQRDDDCEAWRSVERLLNDLRDQWAKAKRDGSKQRDVV